MVIYIHVVKETGKKNSIVFCRNCLKFKFGLWGSQNDDKDLLKYPQASELEYSHFKIKHKKKKWMKFIKQVMSE